MKTSTNGDALLVNKTQVAFLGRFFYNIRKHSLLYILMIPGILYFIIFCYIPLYGIQIAFKEYYSWVGIAKSEWIGFQNFSLLFSSGTFSLCLRNTLIITGLKIFLGFPCPIILALMLNEISSRFFKRFSQTVSYIPNFLSWVILYGIVFGLLNANFGVVNSLLTELGFEKIPFLASLALFRPIVVFTAIWKGVGWTSIIYLAAISGINQELYDSAKVDGATRWQQLVCITIPQIMPTAAIILLLSIGGILSGDFEQLLMFMGSSSYLAQVGDVFETVVYKEGVMGARFSYGTAVGLFQSFFGMLLVIVSNKIASDKLGFRGLW